MPSPESSAHLDTLRQQAGRDWPAIRAAQTAAATTLEAIRAALHAAPAPLDSEDVSIVVFGSVARGERTLHSDLDWTLLIDGQADPGHAAAARRFAQMLAALRLPEPATRGVFGNLAFSHVLIHEIGGEDDSNRNLTQRMLLFLESVPVRRRDAYDRVITGILHRYLANERLVPKHKVPRFLLNDVVRYWRTLGVDFANKFRSRAGQGWAVRHIKLRLSRKLLFASGLLACLACDEEVLRARQSPLVEMATSLENQVGLLQEYVRRTPLDILAEALLQFASIPVARAALDAYDAFLAMLADKECRECLESLSPEQAAAEKRFQEAYALTRSFQESLEQLFFGHPLLSRLLQKYGVF